MNAIFVSAVVLLGAMTSVQAGGDGRCRITDSGPNSLNARTSPTGPVNAYLKNGMSIAVIESTGDDRGRGWERIATYGTKQSIGWVVRESVDCF